VISRSFSPRLAIDLGAIVANWKLLSAHADPVNCGAVVKANAYGLGDRRVVQSLLRAGCRQFFVAHVEEGATLKEGLGTAWPQNASLHVLHGPDPGTEATCFAYGLTPVLNSLSQVNRWQDMAYSKGRTLPAAIQVDTGMARLGLAEKPFMQLMSEPQGLQGISPTLIMSHLASAEEPDNPVNENQLNRFKRLRQLLPGAAGCLANSSGIFLGRDYHFDLVRPGAALYGITPVVGQANPMRQVIQVQAQLIQWRSIEAGEGVGYNHTWVAERPARIGTVAIGYADGLLRSASNRAQLRLGSVTVPLIGRVSMDTVTVDLTNVPDHLLTAGAMLSVIDDEQRIDTLALQAGTNAYEILTSLGSRFHRNYLNDNG
jgi:alanine racemase